MITPGRGGDLDNPILGKPEIVDPSADMQAGRPALPPAGQGGGIEAQRRNQFPEKLIGDRLARLRVLLLLYGFS